MKSHFLFLIFIYTCAGLAHNEQAPVEKHCETRLIKAEDVLTYRKMDEEAESVKTIGEMPGSQGGKLIVLERGGFYYSWFSHFQIFLKANQGDPRSLVNTLGSELAYFFGVRQISDNRITIPDVDEVNGAIEKLNVALKDLGYKPIPIRFHAQNIRNHDDMIYIKNFTQRMQLPYADSGPVRVHDAAYHLSSVLLSEELLVPIVEQYSLALKFYEYVQKNADHKLFQQMVRAKYLDHLVERVDVGLGNLQPFFNGKARKKNMNSAFNIYGPDGFLLDVAWSKFSFSFEGSYEILKYLVGDIGVKAKSSVVDDNEWQRLLVAFITEQDVFNDKPSKQTTADVYNSLVKRLEEMSKALKHLQAKGGKP